MKTLIFLLAALLGAGLSAQTTWHKVPTGTSKKLNTIDFPSAKVGYIGGNDSLLLKTTNGGLTWTPLSVSGVTFFTNATHILNLDFVSETTGYMSVGTYGGIYKTTDGGSTWTQVVPAGNICFVGGLYFFDAQNGFIAGSGCFQGEAIDKMISGTLITATISHPSWNSMDRVVDMDFLNTSFGLAASHGGNILRTTDGGLTWDSIPSGQAGDIPLTSVAVINSTLAYAGYNSPGSGSGLLRTTDGGLTWSEDGNSATFFYPAFLSLHEAGSTVYSGAKPSFGNGGLIFEGTAGVWTVNTVGHPINDLSSYSNTVVFGVGDSGYVVVNKLLTVGLSSSCHNNNLLVHPNPTKDILFIEAPPEMKDQNASLSIISATGQLLNELPYSANDLLDLSAYPPGLYFLQLKGSDFTRHTRVVRQ